MLGEMLGSPCIAGLESGAGFASPSRATSSTSSKRTGTGNSAIWLPARAASITNPISFVRPK